MRRLLIKISLFTVPFFILYLIQDIFFIKDKGDLLRLGYICDNGEYESSELFKNENKRIKNYKTIYEIDLKKNYNFDVLTVGDSFSEIGNIGYQDYFVEKSNKKLLHYDRVLHENPLETLNSLANGDFFDHIKVKYVILQSVERALTLRSATLISNNKANIDSIARIISKRKEADTLAKSKEPKSSKEQFFSRTLIRLPLYNLYYNFDDNAFFSTIYKVKLNKKMFSSNNTNLLFLEDDIKASSSLPLVSDLNNKISNLSEKLSKKGITLVFLPCPDKFEVYYNQIVGKEKYPKPTFFEYYNSLTKKYLHIETDKLLKNAILKEKDIYYYDDTHWSPKAAKIVAVELDRLIK